MNWYWLSLICRGNSKGIFLAVVRKCDRKDQEACRVESGKLTVCIWISVRVLMVVKTDVCLFYLVKKKRCAEEKLF